MIRDWLHGEILKSVFPLLDGKDLACCMLVCHQWKESAWDEYVWKCVCAKKWPSISKKPPPMLSYRRLFATLSEPRLTHLPPPRLSFNDVEFYIDLWSEGSLVFSEAVLGCALRGGIRNPPLGIPDALRAHLDGPECKMMMYINPRFNMPSSHQITASVLVGRRDTNKMACIMNQTVFDYVDGSAFRALAYEYLRFSPRYPFVSGIRAWVSLLFMLTGDDARPEVFGVEIDFCDAATSEEEVLWLLDMLDWK